MSRTGIALLALTLLLALCPASAGAAGWGTPALDLSLAGEDVSGGSGIGKGPQVAIGPQGDVSWIWVRSNGTNEIAQARTRKADGTLSAVQDLSAPGKDASLPQVAVDGDGDAYFAWIRRADDDSHDVAETRRRSAADGTLSSTEELWPGSSPSARSLRLGVSDAGNATYGWISSDVGNNVKSRTRAANGTWTPLLTDPP